MNRQQAVDFVGEHSDDDDLDQSDIEAAFTAIFEREPDDVDRELGLWSIMAAAIDNHSALAAIFFSDPGNVDQWPSLWSMVVDATDDDPACGGDEEDEPQHEKYITINDDPDCARPRMKTCGVGKPELCGCDHNPSPSQCAAGQLPELKEQT